MHDLIEDTDRTLEMLMKQKFSMRIIHALNFLTHQNDVSYDDYIRVLSNNEDAVKVKLVDLKDNSDITRLKGITKKDIARMEKYHWAYNYLSKT
jgi:hypothetical protein